MALEDGVLLVVSAVSPDRHDFLKERAAGDVSLLLSIPVEDRTFGNFVFPWYCLKTNIQTDFHEAQ